MRKCWISFNQLKIPHSGILYLTVPFYSISPVLPLNHVNHVSILLKGILLYWQFWVDTISFEKETRAPKQNKINYGKFLMRFTFHGSSQWSEEKNRTIPNKMKPNPFSIPFFFLLFLDSFNRFIAICANACVKCAALSLYRTLKLKTWLYLIYKAKNTKELAMAYSYQ